jgi:beta-lactam-binding protein with PASTA domain
MAHPVPTDFEDALAAAPAAREAFWALPPAKVDEWVGWIEGARRPRTRRSRIAEAVTRLGGAAPVAAAETTVVETNGAAPVAPRPPRESAGLWLLALAFLLIVAGLIYFFAVRNHHSSTPAAARSTVPKVVGLREPAAKFQLRQQKLAASVVRVAAAKPRGIVVGQKPTAGQSVQQGTSVAIVVSRGPAAVLLPSVVGLPAAVAAKRLQALGVASEQKPIASAKPPGTVVAQTPASGQSVKPGTPVVLEVSKTSVAVPNVSGQTQQAAAAALKQAGLAATLVQVPSSQQAGTVVAQNPAAGKKVARGSSVRINVSKGAAAQHTTSPTTTQPSATTSAAPASSLPPAPPQGSGNDYRGMQLAPAVQQIAQGRQQSIVLYVASAKPAGTVVSNGTVGSKMRLAVSAGPRAAASVDVPDVNGEDAAQAQSDLEAAGFTVQTVQWPVSDQSLEGTVVAETPAGGRKAPRGAAIVLYIGSASGG